MLTVLNRRVGFFSSLIRGLRPLLILAFVEKRHLVVKYQILLPIGVVAHHSILVRRLWLLRLAQLHRKFICVETGRVNGGSNRICGVKRQTCLFLWHKLALD